MGRRNGLAVETVRPGQVELASQADNAASAPPQSNKAAPTEVAHSDNDGHGHGESVQTSEGGAQSASAVKQGPGQKADSDLHGDKKTGRSKHAGHDESLSTEDQQRVAELAQQDAEVRRMNRPIRAPLVVMVVPSRFLTRPGLTANDTRSQRVPVDMADKG